MASRPAAQVQEHCRGQVAVGDVDRGGEHREQVGAQPVAQPPFVAGGPVVVAGDGAQLRADLAVRDQFAQLGELVQGEQAADPGVFGIVFLAGRAAAAGDQVRVDRQHGEPGIEQRFDQQPMTGLQHHPDLGRIRLQSQAPSHQPGDPVRAGLDAELLDHPLTRQPQRDVVMVFGPVQTDSQHRNLLPSRRTGSVEARRRADGPVLTGQHPQRRQTPTGHPRGRRLTSVLPGQASEAFLGGSR
jgi:hypothetical protein